MQPDAVDGTTEVTNKRGNSWFIKKHQGTTNGSSQSNKKKQRPEISNANLANQLKKVPALNSLTAKSVLAGEKLVATYSISA